MKIVQVHNRYRFFCGEDDVFDSTVGLLSRNGISVILLTRNSQNIKNYSLGKIHSFIKGLYCFSSARDITQIIQRECPDVVHIHNIYPLLSPSILLACRREKTPVVMTCHNYRLTCPTGFHLRNGNICELCFGGSEYWCFLKNCRRNIWESAAYYLRNTFARKFRLFKENVTLFIALTGFAKQHLTAAGFEKDRIIVLPNKVSIPESPFDPLIGRYIAYVGRMSIEKGIGNLLEACRFLPELEVRLAGEGPDMPAFKKLAPKNVFFKGKLDREEIEKFYGKARFIIAPSEWYEMCPLVILEAMSYGLPVIASRIGGLSEIVEDGVTGFLFEPGSAIELRNKMRMLWENPGLCKEMGEAGRTKIIQENGEDAYYKQLISVYKKAIDINNQRKR